MDLKVIGTGFGRTGTDSMREALNMLGFGPCHHMMELQEGSDQRTRWRHFLRTGEGSWPELFEGYASCVDWPSAYYWRELIDFYPEARVLLTWRPAEDWWRSFENTILKFVASDAPGDSVGKQVIPKVFGPEPVTRERAIATYEANVAEVKATVPAERLLVHKVGDGWEPLCAHLGVPVPDAPYPHRNTTRDMQDRLEQMRSQQQ